MDKETLKAMVQDIIHDRMESAEQIVHDFIVAKTQKVSGLGQLSQTTPSTPSTYTQDKDLDIE